MEVTPKERLVTQLRRKLGGDAELDFVFDTSQKIDDGECDSDERDSPDSEIS